MNERRVNPGFGDMPLEEICLMVELTTTRTRCALSYRFTLVPGNATDESTTTQVAFSLSSPCDVIRCFWRRQRRRGPSAAMHLITFVNAAGQ
jgi:hypothetical protein